MIGVFEGLCGPLWLICCDFLTVGVAPRHIIPLVSNGRRHFSGQELNGIAVCQTFPNFISYSLVYVDWHFVVVLKSGFRSDTTYFSGENIVHYHDITRYLQLNTSEFSTLDRVQAIGCYMSINYYLYIHFAMEREFFSPETRLKHACCAKS